MMSLPMARCSVFLLRLPGKLGRQYRAMLMVEPVLRTVKDERVIVDRGSEQQAVDHQPGKPVPVINIWTGQFGKPACITCC